MLLRRYRRHSPYLVSYETQSRSRLVARLLIAAVALLIIWFVGRRVLSIFDYSSVDRSGTVLTVEQGSDNVFVSLQGAEAQRGENNLKMYAGDKVTTKQGGNAILTFFDGTRMRLDESTDVAIVDSTHPTAGTSVIDVNIASGRVWVMGAAQAGFSGAITRTVEMPSISASLPAETSGLFSDKLVIVMKAKGIGVTLNLHIGKGTAQNVIVGEGQMFTLSDGNRAQIANGEDPYTFRDPVNTQLFKDAFLAKSYALSKTSATGGVALSAGTGGLGTTDLIVSSPANGVTVQSKNITVSGQVSSHIKTVRVNGYDASIRSDGSFSVDLALTIGQANTIHIEAQDEQGITLADATRTVKSVDKLFPPVTVTAPVASGGTLTTGNNQVEIAGAAPDGTRGIVINDYRLQLYKPGSSTWSYLASNALGNLNPGKNAFVISAVDANGNKGIPVTIYIDYQPGKATTTSSGSAVSAPLKQNPPLTPGVLSVSQPAPGTAATVSQKEALIEGATSKETATISVNGYTLNLYQAGKTTWNYIASVDLKTMKLGRNVYRIVARNAKGEILDVLEYTIIYRP